MFKIIEAYYENGKICLLMSDHKEIRFPIDENTK